MADANSNIRLAPQKVLIAVGEGELDHYSRMFLPECGENRRQKLDAKQLRSGNSDSSTRLLPAARSGPDKCLSRCRHCLGMRPEFYGGIGRQQSLRRTSEEHNIENPFDLVDMSPERRLRQAKCSGCSREIPFPQHGEKGSAELPIEISCRHTDLYNRSTAFDNSFR